MTRAPSTFTPIDYRRALEALRNGVPNRDAVRVLGCDQADVQARFTDGLDALGQAAATGRGVPGMLVSGDFGTGKSHVLEHLQEAALQRRFVCSRVVISKETPLYDLGKLVRAAIDTAEVPDCKGQAVSEIALKMNVDSSAYTNFYRWAHHNDSGLSTIFPATLLMYERLKSDPELIEKITNFWSGERLPIADVRGGLKQLGETAAYPVRAVKASQLAQERLRFVSRLILGAGYSGWVILVDEVELVGRYSVLQRGKSYAELARLLGKIEDDAFSVFVVATITDDYDIEVLQEKGDRDLVGPKLRSKGTDEWQIVAARAEVGMRAIERDPLPLAVPDESSLRQTYERMSQIHGGAYGWEPTQVWSDEPSGPRRMRSHVRRWITQWDLHRLYPGSRPELEEEEMHVSYGEDTSLEEPADAADSAESNQDPF